MAGDWIKMRVDLFDDPAVISIAANLDISEDDVVGKLHRLWSWADRHTTDGCGVGITPKWLDRYVGKSGFAEAVIAVCWVEFDARGIKFPNFDRHNGKSAKTRAEASIRQRLSRKNRDDGVTGTERAAIPKPFRTAVLERDKYTCCYCGTDSDPGRENSQKARLSIDHIIPATRGGRSAMDNLLTACKLCNAEKNDRTPEEWGMIPTFLADYVTYESQKICDSRVTREEKRREDINTSTPAPKSRRKPQTQVPEDFAISEGVQKWAAANGFGRLPAHLEHFKLTCAAKGYAYSDHDAALKKAIRADWAKLGKEPVNRLTVLPDLPRRDGDIPDAAKAVIAKLRAHG